MKETHLPPWFRQEIPQNTDVIKNRLKAFENLELNTVCLSARCPNINSCFENNSVTFMILGNNCSRNCSFCAVGKDRPECLNLSEPYNLALTIRNLDLRYIVITSVTRDDLALGGATQYARAVYLIRRLSPRIKIELLIPDFNGLTCPIELVVKPQPEVIAHNLETVASMYPKIRPLGNYRRSLSVLKRIREFGFAGLIKSGIMLGFGETEKEVFKALSDLQKSSCDILTLGQYLAPSERHSPVREFIAPSRFDFYRQEALKLGFKAVEAGPLVRSSYRAEKVYSEIAR